VALNRFTVQAPKYPFLDLPASFLGDIIIAPLTSSVAFYEVLFN
jgi:hypothetical protein